jgi:hypothetical protein
VYAIIYSIIPNRHGKEAMNFDGALRPTERMKAIADDAQKIDTKLWLGKGECETLVACGRFTLCAVLLDYYWNNTRFKDLPKPDSPQSAYHFVYLEWQKLRAEFA